jgi:hypothetical protein
MCLSRMVWFIRHPIMDGMTLNRPCCNVGDTNFILSNYHAHCTLDFNEDTKDSRCELASSLIEYWYGKSN